jgi:GABA(A) receptor-associated protein
MAERASSLLFAFKSEMTVEQRRALVAHIRERYPERVPVILERDGAHAAVLPTLPKKKYLAPADLSLSSFLNEIRRALHKADEEGEPEAALHGRRKRRSDGGADGISIVFMFGDGNAVANASQTMGQVYRVHADPDDGFLYLMYTAHNAFGGSV